MRISLKLCQEQDNDASLIPIIIAMTSSCSKSWTNYKTWQLRCMATWGRPMPSQSLCVP